MHIRDRESYLNVCKSRAISQLHLFKHCLQGLSRSKKTTDKQTISQNLLAPTFETNKGSKYLKKVIYKDLADKTIFMELVN